MASASKSASESNDLKMSNNPIETGPSPRFESGPLEDRASAEGTSGGEYERGMLPLVRGVRGISPEKILIYGCL